MLYVVHLTFHTDLVGCIFSIDETTLLTLFTTACVMVLIGVLMRNLFYAEQQQIASGNRPRSSNRQSNGYPRPRQSGDGTAPERLFFVHVIKDDIALIYKLYL